MKKVFLALMCVTAIALVGCKGTASNPIPGGINGSSLTLEKIAALDNTTEKCWQLGIGASAMGHSDVSYDYMWCTEREAAQWAYECYQVAKQFAIGASAEYAYKESSAKTVEECNILAQEAAKENGEDWGDDDEDFDCWKISYEIAGYTQTMYSWNTEEGVAAIVESYKSTLGVSCNVEKIKDKDENSCQALDTQQ